MKKWEEIGDRGYEKGTEEENVGEVGADLGAGLKNGEQISTEWRKGENKERMEKGGYTAYRLWTG